MRRAGKATLYDKNKNILHLDGMPLHNFHISFSQVLSVSFVIALGRQQQTVFFSI